MDEHQSCLMIEIVAWNDWWHINFLTIISFDSCNLLLFEDRWERKKENWFQRSTKEKKSFVGATALFANCSPQFAIIGRCAGRPASSRHRNYPHYLFTLPAKRYRCWFALLSFNPERVHLLSSKYLSLDAAMFGRNNRKNGFDMAAEKRPDVRTNEDTKGKHYFFQLIERGRM